MNAGHLATNAYVYSVESGVVQKPLTYQHTYVEGEETGYKNIVKIGKVTAYDSRGWKPGTLAPDPAPILLSCFLGRKAGDYFLKTSVLIQILIS